jgi:hypothetical protein
MPEEKAEVPYGTLLPIEIAPRIRSNLSLNFGRNCPILDGAGQRPG